MSSSTGTQRKDAEGVDGVDRLFQEINLLNLERFLFSTDRKRPVRPGTLLEFIDSKEKFYKIKVGDFGQPGELAYRVLHAVMFSIVQKGRICESGICTFPDRVLMSKRQLTRLCGRSWSGASNDADYHRAIMSLHDTRVEMEWYDKANDQTKVQSFHVFANADFIVNGDVRHNPKALKSFESIDVTVNRIVLNGYDAGYFRAFNMARLLPLRCLGQMLYKRVFIAFGQIHQKGVRHPVFEKDCDVISTEWFNQPPRRYLSDIERQLGNHLRDLKEGGTLKTFEIVPMKSKNKKGHKLVCTPGPAFYEDYALYLETAAAALPLLPSRLEESDPGALLAYFHQKLGRTHTEFGPSERKQALELLTRHSLAEGKDLVDFALSQKAPNVVPQVFGFVVGYLGQWSSMRGERMKRQAHKAATATCTLCDERGYLHYLKVHAGARSETLVECSHNRAQIARWAADNGYSVPSLSEPREG